MDVLHPLVILLVLHIAGAHQPSYFERATHSRFFVDKTPLLETFFQHRISLITCPTNFGKSTNLDMIRQFFQLSVNQSNGQKMDKTTARNYRLFTNKSLNLQIARNDSFIERHLGEYPVLYLNFKNPRGNSSDEIINWMIERIGEIFVSYHWLYHMMAKLYRLDPFRNHLLADYDRILNGTADIWDIMSGVELLVEFIVKHFHTDLMIFFDDFDAPINYAIERGINEYDVIKAVNMMLFELLKGTEFTSHVIIAGISGAFQHWDYEQLERHHFLNNHPYAEYFGFTDAEVDKLLTVKNTRDQRTKIKQFFNGYRIDQTCKSLYNPKAILRYLETDSFRDYDQTDISFSAISTCLRHEKFFKQISTLLFDKRITTILGSSKEPRNFTVFVQMSQNNCTNPDTVDENLLSVFYDHGYLTPTDQRGNYQIPNKIMENKLRKQFHNFFQHFYGITITSARLATGISSILNSQNTTDDMLTTLAHSLNRMFEGNRNSQPFTSLSIVIGAILYNLADEPGIELKMIINEGEHSNYGIDLTKSIADGEKILLIITVTFRKTLNDAVQQAKNYVPLDHRHTLPFHVVKYLGINIDEKNHVEVGKAE